MQDELLLINRPFIIFKISEVHFNSSILYHLVLLIMKEKKLYDLLKSQTFVEENLDR